jgi:hypothetical protein
MSCKVYMNQNYATIKAQCLSRGELFKDDTFPANSSSLTKKGQPKQPTVWKRPKDFCEKSPEFIVNGIAPNDISQGCLGNCE